MTDRETETRLDGRIAAVQEKVTEAAETLNSATHTLNCAEPTSVRAQVATSNVIHAATEVARWAALLEGLVTARRDFAVGTRCTVTHGNPCDCGRG